MRNSLPLSQWNPSSAKGSAASTVLVAASTPLDSAAKVAAQIKAQLEAQFWQKPGAPNTLLRVTASFGVAELAGSEGTSALLARADGKLYEAKQAGRNRVAA